MSMEVPDEPLAELLDILRDTEEPCRQVGPVDVVGVVFVVFVLTVIVLITLGPRKNAEAEEEELLESEV